MSDSRLAYLTHRGEVAYGTIADKASGITVLREALTDDGEPDGLHWEFKFTWHDFGRDGEGVRIEIYDDAWQAFAELPELWAALADRHVKSVAAPSVQPHDVTTMLDYFGFTNATKFEEPF